MGKGKGALDYWAAPIRPGQVLFELDRCSKATAMQVGWLTWVSSGGGCTDERRGKGGVLCCAV
jgi:hypothetical protein